MVDKVTKRIKIDFKGAKGEKKAEIKRKAGEFLVSEINRSLDMSVSPVSGGSFKRKLAKGGSSHLFEEGDMRAHLTFEEYRDGIEIGIFDSTEAQKADNHNKNSPASRRTKVPRREFIPKNDQVFTKRITTGIEKIVSKALRSDGEE